MFSYKVNKVLDLQKKIDVFFEVFNDGVKVADEKIILASEAFYTVVSDERLDFIKKNIENQCKRLMVVSDVKAEFIPLMETVVDVAPVVYDTRSDVEAREAAEAEVRRVAELRERLGRDIRAKDLEILEIRLVIINLKTEYATRPTPELQERIDKETENQVRLEAELLDLQNQLAALG